MAAVWSDAARLDRWLEIEVLAVEAWAAIGVVPTADATAVRARAAYDAAAVASAEARTRHDLAAFVDVVAASVGDAGRWIHRGLTSSDVLDTALALALRDAADLLLGRLDRILRVVRDMALTHRDTLMVGRTHGVHAEPTTFGHKLALVAFRLDRDRARLRRARSAVAVGAISGAVGTYAAVDPRVEEHVCAALGLDRVEASDQVIARDRHAEFVAALAICASTLDAIATELRHLARTEVREVEEPFAAGQKGSSAMPHKRNPVRCERVSGLARVVRAAVPVALEDAVLWHERDLSHSSAERVVLPDACLALDFMLADLTEVLEGLRVFPERMRANLDLGDGLVCSQRVLLALVDRGWARDRAYGVVQRAAAAAWDEGASFREEIAADAEVASALTPTDLEGCFDVRAQLGNLDGVFERLGEIEG
jgi:adenylosuccinate lyase